MKEYLTHIVDQTDTRVSQKVLNIYENFTVPCRRMKINFCQDKMLSRMIASHNLSQEGGSDHRGRGASPNSRGSIDAQGMELTSFRRSPVTGAIIIRKIWSISGPHVYLSVRCKTGSPVKTQLGHGTITEREWSRVSTSASLDFESSPAWLSHETRTYEFLYLARVA